MSPQLLISVMLTVNLQKDEVDSLKRLKTLFKVIFAWITLVHNKKCSCKVATIGDLRCTIDLSLRPA